METGIGGNFTSHSILQWTQNSSKKLILLKKNDIGPDPGNLYLKAKGTNKNWYKKHKHEKDCSICFMNVYVESD